MAKSNKTEFKMQPELLLTTSEKTSLALKVVTDLPNLGSMFLPDDNFYKDAEAIKNLELKKKILCEWLAIKPSTVKVRFNQIIQSSTVDIELKKQKHFNIQLEAKYSNNPFYVAAILSHSLSHVLVEKSKEYEYITNDQIEEIVDLVSTYAGLGLLILNGYGYQKGYFFEIKNRLYSFLTGKQGSNFLGYYSLKVYVSIFLLAGRSFNILPRSYLEHMLPGTYKLLAFNRIKNSGNIYQLDFTGKVLKKTKLNNIITSLVLILVIILSSFLVFSFSHRTKTLSPELQSLKDDVAILKKEYDICLSSVETKKQLLNSNDLFVQQTIEGDLNRCISIRNQHNNLVDNFNAAKK